MELSDLKSRYDGFYSLAIYLPASEFARRLRVLSRRIRGKWFSYPTVLPKVSWKTLFSSRPIRLVETAKASGNVRFSELGILAKAAADVESGTEIIEIGTFDGRTALNLALNSPPDCKIFTLDLPPDSPTLYKLDPSERPYVDKVPGVRFKNDSGSRRLYAGRIVQLFGDSATFNWAEHLGKAGLIFVDGSHTYEYVMKDIDTAFKLVTKGGVILWHDYGIWPGVTQALEECEAREKRHLLHIQGTSLVCAKVT